MNHAVPWRPDVGQVGQHSRVFLFVRGQKPLSFRWFVVILRTERKMAISPFCSSLAVDVVSLSGNQKSSKTMSGSCLSICPILNE